MPRRTSRLALGAITSVVLLVGITGCGEDVPTKADFIDRVEVGRRVAMSCSAASASTVYAGLPAAR